MTKHEYYMGFALRQAEKALILNEVPIGAIIVCDHVIIAQTHNRTEMYCSALAHAEMLAIQQANVWKRAWRLSNCTMYVTLEPCAMCAGALVNSRISELVYGLSDLKSGAVHSLFNITNDSRLNHKIRVVSDVRAEEAKGLLQSFFSYTRYRNKQKKLAKKNL